MTAIKLAVADDHAAFRTVLVQSLLSLNSALQVVIQAKNGLELKEKLYQQSVDVVLTDFSMPPTLDGLDLVKALRREFRHIPVIVMSFGNDPTVRQGILNAGAFGFIAKSEDLSVLENLIRQALLHSKRQSW